MLTCLLYASETWTFYQHQIKYLERFHQYWLRHLLGIKWEYLTPDTEILEKAKSASISMRVMKNQMWWTGHLVRMGDDRLPKRIFMGSFVRAKASSCPKVCKSAGGLKRHLLAHNRGILAATNQKAPFECSICNLVCKSAAGLKSYLRAYGRRNADELEVEEWQSSVKMYQSTRMQRGFWQ